MKNIFHVYILRSETAEKFYIGHTYDLERRVREHNSGKSGYTKPYRPWQLIYSENYLTRKEAMQSKRYLKSLKDPDLLMKYVAGWRSSTSQGS